MALSTTAWGPAFAQASAGERQTRPNIEERLIRVEEGVKNLEKRFDDMNKRFDDVNNVMLQGKSYN